MNRNPVLFLVACLIVGLFSLVQVKMYVQKLDDDVALLEEKKSILDKDLKILKAEWYYLNRENRLEDLANKFLNVSMPSEVKLIDDFYNVKKKQTKIKHIVKVSAYSNKWNYKSRSEILSKVKGLRNIGSHGIVNVNK